MATSFEFAAPPGRAAPVLARLRAGIRRYIVLEALASLGLFLAGWFWIALALDYGVFRLTALRPLAENGVPVLDWVLLLPLAVRVPLLVIPLAVAVALVVRSLVLRITREFRPDALALLLERRFPEVLGDRLITAIELADSAKAARLGYSQELVDATIREADERLAGLPIDRVFDWQRLKRRGLWLLVVAFAPLLVVAVGHLVSYRRIAPAYFVYDCAQISAQLAERNLFLRRSPWPRHVQLELVQPATDDLRIGRDAKAPHLEVRAVKWVVADAAAPTGWRALTWADLRRGDLLASPVPELPIAVFAAAAGPDALSRTDEADWTLDEIERLLTREETQMAERVKAAYPGPGGEQLASDLNLIVTVDLPDRAEQPGMARRLRQLVVPESVTVHYRGEQTANTMPLRGAGQEYAGELADLKESVRYSVRAYDFATSERAITLVPPPQLTLLACDEERPAYIYHRPPPDGGAAALKPLTQQFREQRLSLDGPVSRYAIPAGTSLVMTGETDKVLATVALAPRVGKTNDIPLPAPVLDPDRRRFTLTFPPLTRVVEFDIELLDADNVASRRPVVIDVVPDRTPDVEVQVEGLRKTEGGYLVTPVAEIPFVGRVTDDYGLDRVEYEASYEALDAPRVAANRAAITAGLMLLPATPGGPAPVPAQLAYLAKPETRTDLAAVPLPTFARQAAERAARAPRLDELLRLLADAPGENLLIRQFELRPEQGESFDLEQHLVGVRVSSSSAPEYRLRVAVKATDNNVLTGPRVGRSKETFTFLVVSEAYLRREIAKEEEALKAKLKKSVDQLKNSRARLGELAARVKVLTPAEPKSEFDLAGSRAQAIEDNVGRNRDTVAEVLNDYARILRELQRNRVEKAVIESVSTNIVSQLDASVRTDFPKSEAAQKKVRAALDAKQVPEPGATDEAERELTDLIERLNRVLESMGELADIRDLVLKAAAIRDGAREGGALIDAIKAILDKDTLEGLLAPPVLQPSPVILTKNQKAPVVIKLDKPVVQKTTVQFAAPAGSGLKVPAPLTLAVGTKEIAFELTAGDKDGEFSVNVTPTPGKAVELKVTVK